MIGTCLYYSHGFTTDELREWADKGDTAAKLSLDMQAHMEKAGWVAPAEPMKQKTGDAPLTAQDEASLEIERQQREWEQRRQAASAAS